MMYVASPLREQARAGLYVKAHLGGVFPLPVLLPALPSPVSPKSTSLMNYLLISPPLISWSASNGQTG